MRYENLIADSEAELRRICGFIGVRFSKQMFDYASTSSYSLPDPTQGFKWRRKLSPKELLLLEARIGPQLAARGYELSCKTPPKVSSLRARWMHWRSRMGVLKHRLKTFGFALLALEFAPRLLGLTTAHDNVQRSIDEITDRRLR